MQFSNWCSNGRLTPFHYTINGRPGPRDCISKELKLGEALAPPRLTRQLFYDPEPHMPQPQTLPIDEDIACIAAAVASSRHTVIEAPPGSGKTTRVVPALAGAAVRAVSGVEPIGDQKVLLIQPRRIAARSAAERISTEHASKVGQWAGYHVRFDRKISSQTKIVAMTPGILLRRLQSDPVLEDVSIVVLDEFHERSLEYDLLLGMLKRIADQLRPDLKLVVMSATLDTQSVLEYLPDAQRIVTEGRAYPVEIQHGRFEASRNRTGTFEHIVASVTDGVSRMASRYEGDVLAFLPGVGEINEVSRRLDSAAAKHDWHLIQLHGSLSPEKQRNALDKSPRRKVILATNIAETSLTIDGVRIVIDSGYARVQRTDSRTGLNRLQLEPISQASAGQRAGRAGRTASGICFRIWDEIAGRSRPKYLAPEVQRVDLTSAALQLLCWGESDLNAFPWVTAPPAESLSTALTTLEHLGALTAGRPNHLANRLVSLPLDPRLGKLMIVGAELRIKQDAALAAALLSERDVVLRDQWRPHGECDITARLTLLKNSRSSPFLHTAAASQVHRAAKQLVREYGDEHEPTIAVPDIDTNSLSPDARLRVALLAAFPDRVARRRQHGSRRGTMVGGKGVQLARQSGTKKSEYFLCLDLDAKGAEAQVRIASPIDQNWLQGVNRRTVVERFFNPTLAAVVSRRREYWCDLMLSEQPVETEADEDTARTLAQHASHKFFQLLPKKNKDLIQWCQRVEWLRHELAQGDAKNVQISLPSFEGIQCAEMLENWCYGLRTFDQLKQLPWESLLPSQLSNEAKKKLDALAPPKIQLPRGRWVNLVYQPKKTPVLAAKIQELFGWHETPRIAGGRTPLLLHLLAPNGRPQQVTDDLASFWKNTYPVVRRDLRGRYPKHAWPEDPLANVK